MHNTQTEALTEFSSLNSQTHSKYKPQLNVEIDKRVCVSDLFLSFVLLLPSRIQAHIGGSGIFLHKSFIYVMQTLSIHS